MLSNMKSLLGILIILAGLAYWATQQGKDNQVTPDALMPSWQNDSSVLAGIDQVILSKDDEKIKLTKQNGHWVLNDGFYASIDPLFKLLQGLKSAAILEVKTANPDNHGRLELAANDLKVTILSSAQVLADIHLGKTTNTGQTFVRWAGDDQSLSLIHI